MLKIRKRWKPAQKADFLIRIGTFLKEGYTISESIDFFIKYEKEEDKIILRKILNVLMKGRKLSEAITQLSLPENIQGFVYFAENYGDLAKGLIKGGELYKNNEMNKQKLRKLLIYPIFLLWLLGAFSIIMFAYLFPHLTNLYSSLSIDLPPITLFVISIVRLSPYFAIAFLLLLFALIFYYHYIFKKKDALVKARLLTKIPLLRWFYKTIFTYYFCIHLSCLLKNGMSILEALRIFEKQRAIPFLNRESVLLKNCLVKGESLQNILQYHQYYHQELVFIVDHGQRNGRLPDELEYYASWLFQQFQQKVKLIFMLLQPALFVCIGLIILLLFSSILIPLFKMVEGI